MSDPSVTLLRDEVRPSDADPIRAIVRSSGFFSPAEEAIAVELVVERLGRGEASGYNFLIAERAGDVAGFACFGRIPGTAASFDLYWIAVDAGAQRAGIGTKLLLGSEERMAAAGARRIYVETSSRPQYEPTRAFYRRHGYTDAAILEDYYAPGDSKVILIKTIDR
ncbi:MAG: GNAT family N-acetyltransferase [Planctomycetes bacterium]|nr:GNAT family N-acetyltransferase [Planctomycetota bacterium]